MNGDTRSEITQQTYLAIRHTSLRLAIIRRGREFRRGRELSDAWKLTQSIVSVEL